jgi:hypothetical protein
MHAHDARHRRAVLKEAKKRAAEEGGALTRLIERALRAYLYAPPARSTRYRLKLVTSLGRPVAGVDLDDRDALYDRMDPGR